MNFEIIRLSYFDKTKWCFFPPKIHMKLFWKKFTISKSKKIFQKKIRIKKKPTRWKTLFILIWTFSFLFLFFSFFMDFSSLQFPLKMREEWWKYAEWKSVSFVFFNPFSIRFFLHVFEELLGKCHSEKPFIFVRFFQFFSIFFQFFSKKFFEKWRFSGEIEKEKWKGKISVKMWDY